MEADGADGVPVATGFKTEKKARKQRKQQKHSRRKDVLSGVDTPSRKRVKVEDEVTPVKSEVEVKPGKTEKRNKKEKKAKKERGGTSKGGGAPQAGASNEPGTPPDPVASPLEAVAEASPGAAPRRRGKNKKRRPSEVTKIMRAAAAAAAGAGDSNAAVKHNFPTEPDDHCETPSAAYADLDPFLAQLASRLGKTRATLRVYDPYFCAGGVIEKLHALGYCDVHNVNSDFYADAEAGRTPDYDVLVTNPPYSGDHPVRLTQFAAASGKPFALLMPNFVYTKAEYQAATLSHAKPPVYLVPGDGKRYVYTTPSGLLGARKSVKAGVEKHTSPFVTFWYCHFGDAHKDMLAWHSSAGGPTQGEGRPVPRLHRTQYSLPFEFKSDHDPEKRRERSRRRHRK